MLKMPVQFTDYNDNPAVEVLYFHLSRDEMMDLGDLEQRLETWRKSTEGEVRQLTTKEIRDMLDMVKLVIKKAYGQKSDDGKRFSKSEEIYKAFEESAAFDAFLFSLFEDPTKADEFMKNIVPKGFSEEAPATVPRPLESVSLPTNEGTVVEPENTKVPAWIAEDRDPTDAETRTMSQAELLEAFRRKSQRS